MNTFTLACRLFHINKALLKVTDTKMQSLPYLAAAQRIAETFLKGPLDKRTDLSIHLSLPLSEGT